jgi:hypothetical protein
LRSTRRRALKRWSSAPGIESRRAVTDEAITISA